MRVLLCSLFLFVCTCVSAQSNIKAGSPAPPINVTDWVLNVPKDKDFEGKFVVLEFWATWCGPCIAAIPHLNNLQEEFQRDDLYFISITDESLPKINRFIDRLDFKSIVASDQSKQTHIAYGDGKRGLEAYPMTVLIDPKGAIQWIGEPKQLTSEVMRKFLSLKLSPTHLMKQPEAEEIVITGDDMGGYGGIPQATAAFLERAAQKDLPYLLEILKVAKSDEGSMVMKGKALFYASITIPELYSDLFSEAIYDSDFLNDRYYKITFISKHQDENTLERLEEDVNRALNLKKEIYEKDVIAYTLRMKSGKRLPPSAGNAGLATYSISDNFYIFSNSSVDEMLKEVRKKTGILLYYTGPKAGSHDFVIKIENQRAVLESLRSYGFILTEQQRTIKAVRLVEQ